jgi:hypothetical protein
MQAPDPRHFNMLPLAASETIHVAAGVRRRFDPTGKRDDRLSMRACIAVWAVMGLLAWAGVVALTQAI